jgi:hypothetical protein
MILRPREMSEQFGSVSTVNGIPFSIAYGNRFNNECIYAE